MLYGMQVTEGRVGENAIQLNDLVGGLISFCLCKTLAMDSHNTVNVGGQG